MKNTLYILLALTLAVTACKKENDPVSRSISIGSALPFFTPNCKLATIYSIRVKDSFKEPYITNYYTGDRLDSSVYYNSKNRTWYEYLAPNKRYKHTYFTSNGTTYDYVKVYQELDARGNLTFQEYTNGVQHIYNYDTISHGSYRHIRLISIKYYDPSSNYSSLSKYYYTGIRCDSIVSSNGKTIYEYMPPMKYTYSVDIHQLKPIKKLIIIEELNPDGTVKFKRDMDDPIVMCEMEYDCK